jgi:DNA-binding NtrC family response regulator
MAAATQKYEGTSPSVEAVAKVAKGAAGRLLAGVRATQGSASFGLDDWPNKIIWVDDRPENNVYERQALEAMGFEFTLALSTDEALRILSKRRFAAIISDMGRKEGPREGYALLEAVRATDHDTPFFIYAGSSAPKHQREAASRGAQGTTSDPGKLIDMVLQAVPTGT